MKGLFNNGAKGEDLHCPANTVQLTVKFITLESFILKAQQLVYFDLYLTVPRHTNLVCK